MGGAVAGEVLDDLGLVQCGEGALRLKTVQPAGKGRMSAQDFLRGTELPVGTILA